MKSYLFSALALMAILCGCRVPAQTPAVPVGATQVHFKTRDGWTIVGDRYAHHGKLRGTVVLLHQRGGKASDWQSLCRALQAAGFTALAIDQRGAGRSIVGPGPIGNAAPWPTGPDIAGAINYLHRRKVILIGASYGANNSLIYAGQHARQLAGIVLLSPGANYNGLDALTAAPLCKVPVLIYTSAGDPIANSGPSRIAALLPGNRHWVQSITGSRHGTALLPDLDMALVTDCEGLAAGRLPKMES